jgi:hypothetical protein
MEYHTARGHRWTFRDPAPKEVAERYLEGETLNPFAGEVELDHTGQVHRNDIDPDRNAEYHMDAVEFVRRYEPSSIGSIVHDPPWSEHQAESTYSQNELGNIQELVEEYHRVLVDGGRVIHLGYTTTCMPGRLEYDREAVHVVQPFGRRNAYLITVDRKRPRLPKA